MRNENVEVINENGEVRNVTSQLPVRFITAREVTDEVLFEVARGNYKLHVHGAHSQIIRLRSRVRLFNNAVARFSNLELLVNRIENDAEMVEISRSEKFTIRKEK